MSIHSIVSLLVMIITYTKMAKPIKKIMLEGQTCMGPRNHVLDGVHTSATW